MRSPVFAAALIAPMLASAQAGLITVGFDYDASLRAGTRTQTVTPGFPSGGLLQIDNDDRPEAQNSYAAATGFGDANPLDFASGASAAGDAVVTVSNNVRVELTNDSGAAAQGTLNSLIYGGGVGVALANFAAADCVFARIAECGSFLGAPATDTGQVASLFFQATLDGAQLFSGTISVDSINGAVATFDGVTLNNFGLASGNSQFFSWTDTLLDDVDLGIFEIGETKVLEFNISILTGSTRGVDSDACSSLTCAVAQAGFGDPRGSGGGVITYSSAPDQTPFSLFSLQLAPAPVVPVPPALVLFPLGLAALGAARRRGVRAS